MTKIAEVRLTLAAFIYAIENDLKSIIQKYIAPYHSDFGFIGDIELVTRLKQRFNKDNLGINPEDNISDVIDFFDFQDTYTVILKNVAFIPDEIFKCIKEIRKELDEIVPIRNRVMHTRPI